jgi:hypothetical protein
MIFGGFQLLEVRNKIWQKRQIYLVFHFVAKIQMDDCKIIFHI